MIRTRSLLPIIALSASIGLRAVYGQDNIIMWKDFVAAVKSGKMTKDMVQPYEGHSKDVLLKFLADFKGYHDKFNSWREWDNPEAFSVGNQVHYIVTFTWGGQTKSDFCFTLLKEGGLWYFQHVENIFIRLDRVNKFPASEFPDLPAETKAWQREESYWTQMVYFYNVLAKDKRKDYLPNLLRDGAGYFLAARVWIPFVPTERAFILYACWEQNRLRGNPVTLETLTDREATVRIKPQFFALYQRTGHLKGQIAFEDYRRIFETIWRDRATAAGWTLEIKYEDPECLTCIFRFTRKP